MPKRARGTTRPGQRARLQRSGTARPATARPASPQPVDAPAPRPITLTAEEEARAAALEAEILAEEKAAEAARRTRERTRRADPDATPVRAGSISMRAAGEYAYVVRDVRRIAVIGGSLVAVLIGLWAVIQVTGIGPF